MEGKRRKNEGNGGKMRENGGTKEGNGEKMRKREGK